METWGDEGETLKLMDKDWTAAPLFQKLAERYKQASTDIRTCNDQTHKLELAFRVLSQSHLPPTLMEMLLKGIDAANKRMESLCSRMSFVESIVELWNMSSVDRGVDNNKVARRMLARKVIDKCPELASHKFFQFLVLPACHGNSAPDIL